MKILIVASENYFAQALKIALSQVEAELVTADHETALEKFLTEEPTHVLISEYDEYGGGREKWNTGWQTYQDIKSSAGSEVVLRMGLSDYPHKDYLKLPFDKIEDLIDKLKKD